MSDKADAEKVRRLLASAPDMGGYFEVPEEMRESLYELAQGFAFTRAVADNAAADRCEYLKRAEAAERCAARYQWVRDRAWDSGGEIPAAFMTSHEGAAMFPLSGKALDDAIDAELEGERALACAESAHRETR